jgi:single-stranded DNA-specific DHH superfamily exonuclease
MEAASDTFSQFGGHAAAGGFTLADHAVFDFEDRLVEAHERIATDQSALDAFSLLADAILDLDEIDLSTLKHLERLAPFGIDNPKPVFLIRDAQIEKVASFGKVSEHLKITLTRERGALEAVTFFARGTLAKTASTLSAGARAHLLAHLERDTFSRTSPVRLRLLNLKLA